jgi:acyl-CoA thioesterase II
VTTTDRATDQEFLGLVVEGPDTASVEVTHKLMSPRGSFYGGAGLAIACAMMELATGRSALWSTVQFVSGAAHGDRLTFRAEVVAPGHRTSQVRVTAHTAGREVFTAVGAAGAAGTAGAGSDRVSATFATMPTVDPVDECVQADWPSPSTRAETHFGTTEVRETVVHCGRTGTGAEGGAAPSMALWARVAGRPPWTPALLGYVADVVPMSIHRAIGTRTPGGMSLDNSLRVGQPADTEWVLLALHPEAAHEGYAHGTVHLWSPGGTLMGTASQTFALRTRR